ncbi:MAG: type II secretion system F family protein, partial [Candidatus Auribacterota bacterium]|nr:type II secretion system F family protein [Candidatus Auribacterota bacterium]
LATLSKAGLPILTTLDILHQQIDNIPFKKVVGRVREDIIAGNSLSQAMGKHPAFFSPVYVNFIYAGEQGGVLDQVLERLGNLLTHEMEDRKAIKSALMYPKMVIIAMIGAMVIVMSFVIPRFAMIFKSIKMELPLPTRIMLGANHIFQAYWPFLLGGAIVLCALVIVMLRSRKGRLFWDQYKLKIPIVGPLLAKSMISRFCFVFGATVESGLPILETLDMAALTLDNSYVARELNRVKQEVRDGKAIAATLSKIPVFSSLVINMIAIGERSGNLSRMLDELVSHYDLEIQYAISGMAKAMEQVLTMVMAVFVLGLALGVFLPMWNMVNMAR